MEGGCLQSLFCSGSNTNSLGPGVKRPSSLTRSLEKLPSVLLSVESQGSSREPERSSIGQGRESPGLCEQGARGVWGLAGILAFAS